MCADSIKFKKIDKDSPSGGEEEFGTAFESIRQSDTHSDMGSGAYLMEKTYSVTRKTALIIGAIVLIVVMVLFVISAVVGHYTAKSSQVNGHSGEMHLNYSPWGRWGQCSVSCGVGTKLRTRRCLLDEPFGCMGQADDVRVCVMAECNDDQWADWEPWSTCKKTNGVCKRSRNRSCHNTALGIGGARCEGKNVQNSNCKKEDCFGNFWTEWGNWSECSTHCDMGYKKRQRVCKDHRGKVVNITLCSGTSVDKQWCHNVNCKDADECLSSPCQRGTCVDQYKTYKCICEAGWRGNNCEILDHCSSSPCVYGNCTSHPQGYNCTCIGSIGSRCETPLSDCMDIRETGVQQSGVYTVRLKQSNNIEDVRVFCDMETSGGGWTVFQYRFNGSVDFYRNISEYEYGFGNLNGEFWLGLYYMYHLAKPASELRIDLGAADYSEAYETFQEFKLAPGAYYTLDVGSSSGTITPSSSGLLYNDGEHFSTYDSEQSGNNCAEKDHGGWWFDNCAYANLNGYYGTPGSTVGYNGRQEAAMTYRSFKSYESLKSSKMMFRRKV